MGQVLLPNATWLDLLNQWQNKHPQSDFVDDRLKYFINTLAQLAPGDADARQQLLQRCREMLAIDKQYFVANYYITTWGPAVGGATPPIALVLQVHSSAQRVLDNIDTAFSAAKKPANVTEDQWASLKQEAIAKAEAAVRWDLQTSAGQPAPPARKTYKDRAGTRSIREDRGDDDSKSASRASEAMAGAISPERFRG